MNNINLIEALKTQKQTFTQEAEKIYEKIQAIEKVIDIFGNGTVLETEVKSHKKIKWTKELINLFGQTTTPMEITEVYKSLAKKGIPIETKEKRLVYTTLNRLAMAGRLLKNSKGLFKQAKKA